MKITSLRPIKDDASPAGVGGNEATGMRGTDGQDRNVEAGPNRRRLYGLMVAAGALVLITVFAVLLRAWSGSENAVSRERLRIVTVTDGPFLRARMAQGTVVAAVSPTLFAVAPGVISYQVRAGDSVEAGQLLARLASPALENEHQRELATLSSLDAGLQRQGIEIRRQILQNKEQEDLANVQIRAAQRELQRAEAAWSHGVISERDLRRAQDERDSASLNYEHARETAALERESLDLELRTRRIERERQSLVVANLRRRVVDELAVQSPVSGMVANLAATEKANVTENAPLLTVVDLSAFEIEFQVADVYAREIRPGMEASIALDGATHAGIVTGISPEVRQGQVTGRVKFAGDQPGGLRQSQRGTVRILLEQRASARKFERGPDIETGMSAIYLVRGNHAILTPVRLGAASVAEIEVLSGLEAGDQVIVSGARDLGNAPELLIGD